MTPLPILVLVATEAERPTGDFDVVVCGVGKTGAAVSAAERLIDGRRVSAVVSFGVAGAYPASGLAIGDVVVATAVAVLDEGLDAGDRFVPFTRAGMEVPGATWTATDLQLVDRLVSGPPQAFAILSGRVGTVSVCAGTARLADERSRLGALAESMEGAAVAFVAGRFGVPFVEVRGISNLCGPRDGAAFDLGLAVRHAASVLAVLGRRE